MIAAQRKGLLHTNYDVQNILSILLMTLGDKAHDIGSGANQHKTAT